MRSYLSVVFFLIFTGCAVKQKFLQRDVVKNYYEEIIAKFSDVPDAPLLAELKSVVVDENLHDQAQLFYTTTLSVQDVVTFYEQQMERLGWQLIAQSIIKDSVLVYSKPMQICCIVIKNNSFTIYFSEKKGAF